MPIKPNTTGVTVYETKLLIETCRNHLYKELDIEPIKKKSEINCYT